MAVSGQSLRLFYWTTSTYETAILAFAVDEDEAYRIISEEADRTFAVIGGLNVDKIDILEIDIPTIAQGFVIRTTG